MLHLSLTSSRQERYTILCLGAHSDDIEIGCGGTILKLLQRPEPFVVHWVVFSATGERRREAEASAAQLLRSAREKRVLLKNFRMSFFPQVATDIKEELERVRRWSSPDVIFTHYREDLHQDHRTIAELTWNTFRDHLILEYEIPKYDGDLGRPNCFVELDQDICAKKVQSIMQGFLTQRSKPWFTDDTFWALLRLRGVEAQAKSRYAEAFHCRKLVF
jgi:LmbE family N-acetylglucosaminyl deacetylase